MKKIIMIGLVITGITQGAEKRIMPAYAQNKEPIQADLGLALLGAAVALAPVSLFVSAAAKLTQTIGGLFDSTSSDSTTSTDTLALIPTVVNQPTTASILQPMPGQIPTVGAIATSVVAAPRIPDAPKDSTDALISTMKMLLQSTN